MKKYAGVWAENETATLSTMTGAKEHDRERISNEAWNFLRQSIVDRDGKPVLMAVQAYKSDSHVSGDSQVSGVARRISRAFSSSKRVLLDIEVAVTLFILISEATTYLMQIKASPTRAETARIVNFSLGLINLIFSSVTLSVKVKKASSSFSSTVLPISLLEEKKIFGCFEPLDLVDYPLVLVYFSMASYDLARLVRHKPSIPFPSASLWVSAAVFLARFLAKATSQTVSSKLGLNQPQVSVSESVACCLAFLMTRKAHNVETVKNSLLETVDHMGQEKIGICRVVHVNASEMTASSLDSGLWWIILLRAYVESSKDTSFRKLPEIQAGIRRIISINLLCRSINTTSMGTMSCSIQSEALLYFAMQCAKQMLQEEHAIKEIIKHIDERILVSRNVIKQNLWFDERKVGETTNTPGKLMDFVPAGGGYFIGGVHRGEKNWQWAFAGNLMAIVSRLATVDQSKAIMNLIEANWEKPIGEMPLKRVYTLQAEEQSQHASWSGMLWLFTAACMVAEKPEMARKAMALAEQCLDRENWSERFKDVTKRDIHFPAVQSQLQKIGDYLASTLMFKNPENLELVAF